jgi:hypothetical protein
MKNSAVKSRILWGLLFILLSILFYTIHYTIFHDTRHIIYILIDNIAFVFIQVLLVTVIIEYLLNSREKSSMLSKLNMVIGAFFSEVGNDLLKSFTNFDIGTDTLHSQFIISNEWSAKDFVKIKKILSKHDFNIKCSSNDLEHFQKFFAAKRDFLLRLLENPNLLEHELFTELLWAVFHLYEELSHRQNVKSLTESDHKHLAGDINRVYNLLIREWLSHMEHLKNNYPYLFSLALRTNPFDPNASIAVK